jgi:hypothetical protein
MTDDCILCANSGFIIRNQENYSIPGKRQVFLFPKTFRPADGPGQAPIRCGVGTAPGIKRLGSEPEHSLLASTEVRN